MKPFSVVLSTPYIDEGVAHIYRWAPKMEDVGIEQNTLHAVVTVHYTGIKCTGATFCPVPTGSAVVYVPYVFGAIPSSSLLRAHLYTTLSSMVYLHLCNMNIQIPQETSVRKHCISAIWLHSKKYYFLSTFCHRFLSGWFYFLYTSCWNFVQFV